MMTCTARPALLLAKAVTGIVLEGIERYSSLVWLGKASTRRRRTVLT